MRRVNATRKVKKREEIEAKQKAINEKNACMLIINNNFLLRSNYRVKLSTIFLKKKMHKIFCQRILEKKERIQKGL